MLGKATDDVYNTFRQIDKLVERWNDRYPISQVINIENYLDWNINFLPEYTVFWESEGLPANHAREVELPNNVSFALAAAHRKVGMQWTIRRETMDHSAS
jgi:hypothetical protein